MKVIGWRAWLDDKSVYSSRETKLQDTPEDGWLVWCVYFDEPKPDGNPIRRMMSGNDYYWRARGTFGYIYAHDNMKPDPKRYTDIVLRRGRWTDDDTMKWADRESAEAIEFP